MDLNAGRQLHLICINEPASHPWHRGLMIEERVVPHLKATVAVAVLVAQEATKPALIMAES